jgi:hypothetical protein
MWVGNRARGLLLACALGCGTDGGEGGQLHDGGAEDEPVPCTDSYPRFRTGLSVAAGDLTVRLLSIDPQPPRQKRDNDWVLEVVDAAGMPVVEATIVDVDTWMDVHNHGGRWAPDVAPAGEPGRIALSRLDFKMAGPWRVRFGVRASASAAVLRTSLPICVE